MKKIRIICLLLFIVPLQLKAQNETKPNVLIIHTDDHRYTGVHALGGQAVKTPHLDDLDGVSLLPFVKGKKKKELPHDKLYWRYSDGMGYAIRKGNYKFVNEAVRGQTFLFDMSKDPLEHHNLVAQMPDKVRELENEYIEWNKGNVPGLWHDKHPENVLKDKKNREEAMKRASAGEKTK